MIFLTIGSLDLVENSGQNQIDSIQNEKDSTMGKLGLMNVDQCLSLRLRKMLSFVSYCILVLSSLIGLKVDMNLDK